ncbi:MAG TPA: hypothetical protein VN670_03685, partial [Acidobacteriaceae bacterium]|nr:hypothetical protein [Acidobacteriaceae bacterium]
SRYHRKLYLPRQDGFGHVAAMASERGTQVENYLTMIPDGRRLASPEDHVHAVACLAPMSLNWPSPLLRLSAAM